MKAQIRTLDILRLNIVALMTTVIAACGGGGSGNVTAGPNPPPPPPAARTPQQVVFVADDSNLGQRHVYAASDEGGTLVRLTPDFTNANGNAQSIFVSPDQQDVAYVADADMDNINEVYVVPIGGGVATQVSSGFPAGTQIYNIAWAPDSSQIAYVANPQGNAPRGFQHREVFLANRDGSSNRKINGSVGSPPVVSVFLIKWSPDSRYLLQGVFSLDPFHTLIGINTYDTTVGGPNSTRITPAHDWLNGERMGIDYAWSGDGTHVAYRSSYQTAGITELYTVLPDGSANTKVSGALVSGGNVDDLRWSPDGSRIAYRADQQVDQRFDLYVSSADGSSNLRINSGPRSTPGLYQWSPDSNQITYYADQDTADSNEVYVADADGSGSVKLHPPLAGQQFAAFPKWSPDGTQVLYLSNQDDVNSSGFYVSNADGTGNHLVSGPMVQNGSGIFAKWSPDSRRVAYTAGQNVANQWELFVSTADGLANSRSTLR